MESLPALAVTPLVRGWSVPAASPGLDLVMARGVLYALGRGNGQFHWALRIGPDGNILPLRLPPAEGHERFLVLADDASAALVVDDGGGVVWRYVLGAACRGRPLLIDQRVFLPAVDGRVHVLDLRARPRRGLLRPRPAPERRRCPSGSAGAGLFPGG